MPSHWHSVNNIFAKDENGEYKFSEEEREFYESICSNKKPYFFIYIYDYLMRDYKKYIETQNRKCRQTFNISLEELIEKPNKTEDEETFIYFYNRKNPIGKGECAMNKICWYIENEFKDYVKERKEKLEFNYTSLKYNKRCTKKHKQELYDLSQEYIARISKHKSQNNTYKLDDEKKENRSYLKKIFRERAELICPNREERFDIILDMCYLEKNNKQFCWDVIGDLICERLEELGYANT